MMVSVTNVTDKSNYLDKIKYIFIVYYLENTKCN